MNELRNTYGVLSPRLELFRRYLENNDDVQGESVSKLEKDLLFYLEVQKFQVGECRFKSFQVYSATLYTLKRLPDFKVTSMHTIK